ncbi:MAG: cation diffusion facilitator family transporter, partial [Candidatus Riflebacteria bacterium]|nr:cation diffusion facilitator family transporter [Candidatus Riflebacteria bacterium]
MKNKNSDVILAQNSQITKKVTLTGMLVNLFLTISKVIAGTLGNSSSVIADGIHSLSDLSTDIAVLIGVKYWNEPPDADHPYGHRRIEAMISVLIAIALSIAGFMLGYGAITKFRSSNYQAPESFTLIIALISILTKEWLYHWTHKWGKKIMSSAMIANAWHHRSDSLSSIPVAVAIGLAVYNPDWAFMDPVATLAVSAFIIQTAYKISLPSLRELSDAGADQNCLETIEQIVLQVDGVKSVH